MLDVKGWINRNPICLFLPALIIAGCTLIHIVLVTTGVPLADEWRWMQRLLIPYINGEIGFWQYLTGEYALFSHTHYSTLLFMLGSYFWSDLDYSLMAWFGLVGYVGTWLLLIFYIRSLLQEKEKWLQYACFLILTAAYFSPLSDFPWALVVFEYIFYFMAIALLCMYDASLYKKIQFRYFLAALVLVLFAADTPGLMAALTVFSCSVVLSVFGRESWLRPFSILAVIIAFFLFHYLLLGKGIGGNHPLSVSLLALSKEPAAFISSLVLFFAQGLWVKYLMVSLFGEEFRLMQGLLGSAGIALFLWSMSIYFRNQGYKTTQLPFLLATLALVAWFTILTSRYLNHGIYIFDDQRFVRYGIPFYLAAAIALSFAKVRLEKLVLLAAAIFMTGIYSVAMYTENQRRVYVIEYFDNAKTELHRDVLDPEGLANRLPHCTNGLCEPSIIFMRERQLSIFSED